MLLLSVASSIPLLLLCIVGWWIGRFYKLKFGESSHSWILLVGGVLGTLGLLSYSLVPAVAGGVGAVIGEVLMLLGGILIAGGAFWLWYLLMGARHG